MSNVDMIIGGREFKVACAEGEEAHVTDLGRLIDSKVANMNMSGQSEGRMLLFAALLLADELHELKHRGGAVQAPQDAPTDDGVLASSLETVAAALEKCASHLEGLNLRP
jgi:cell division protein ZapA